MSEEPDTVAVGSQTASYPSLSCAGNYLKLSKINGGYLVFLFYTSLTSYQDANLYSILVLTQTKLQISHQTIKTSMKLALVLPFKLKVGRV